MTLSPFLRRHGAYLLLLIGGIGLFLVLALLNHRALGTGYDLGIYDQVVWNLAHGRIFATTLVYETAGTYDHFEPILVLLAPLYWLWSDVRWLLIVQAVALGLGSLPIYLYAYRRLAPVSAYSTQVALAFAVIYLAYPALHHANLNDFHEVALLPPILGFALYGLLRGLPRVLVVFLVLGLLVKEDFAVTALAFGLYILLLRPRGFRRRDGLIIGLCVTAWIWLVLNVLYPALTHGMPYPFVDRRYAWLSDSPEGALRVLLTQPWIVLPYLLQPPKVLFVVRLLAPLLFLPLLGWPVIALALPILFYLMLSSYEPQWSVQSYYNPPLLPILFFALIEVFYRIQRRVRVRFPRAVLAGLTLAVLVAVGISYYVDAPGPGSRRFDAARFQVSPSDAQAYALLDQVPPTASVSTIWPLVSHLSHRERIYTLLARPAQPPDILLTEDDPQAQGAPLYPYAAADDWPPIYHAYQEQAASGPYRLLTYHDSTTLVPVPEPDPAPTPLSLAAYAWLDSESAATAPVVAPGETARLMLAWRRTGTLDRRYVVFVHLLDPQRPMADGSPGIVTQSGHEPGDGRFPTTFWETWTRPPIVLDEQRLEIPPDTPPGVYEVWAGAYDQETGARIELAGTGQGTLVPLGTLDVR